MDKLPNTKSRTRAPAQALSVIFLLFSFLVGAVSVPKFFSTVTETAAAGGSLGNYIQNINRRYEGLITSEKENPSFVNLGSYVNLNGAMAKLVGQPMMNNRIRLSNGNLSSYNETPPDILTLEAAADSIAALSQAQTDNGKHFLFVLTPGQVCKYESLLPEGYSDTTNQSADLLLDLLAQRNVPCLDLRDAMHQNGISHKDAFFITDHHWKPEAGFWAYTVILDTLNQLGYTEDVDTFYTDTNNYQFYIYENCFLGSAGKHTGKYYAGLDDFCVIDPVFDTHITVSYPYHGMYYEGPFRESVNNPYPESYFSDPDYYGMTLYDYYGRSDSEPVLRINKNAPLKQKMLLIGDSFTNIPCSFLSLYNESCYELDMRIFPWNFSEFYTDYDPDIVILMINATGCTDTNAAYAFFDE